MDLKSRTVIVYERSNGQMPFMEWLRSFKDHTIKRAVRVRLERLATGNLGEYKNLGGGLFELKLSGLGLRIYFTELNDVIVVILCGGGKNTKGEQSRDIRKAREYLDDFEQRGVAK